MVSIFLKFQPAKCLALCVALSSAPYLGASAGSYSVPYEFTGGSDGYGPYAGLIFDRAGNMYGTTALGGTVQTLPRGVGVIYTVDPAGKLTTLHTFNATDGGDSTTPLTLGRNTLYGSASGGGQFEGGVIFALGLDGSNYMLLHQFNGLDGYMPIGALLSSPDHGLIGVTKGGGAGYNLSAEIAGAGILFGIRRSGDYMILHAFSADDIKAPNFIVSNTQNVIFGSAEGGGNACTLRKGCGGIFSFDPASGVFSVLYRFTGGTDGAYPILGSIGPDGTLYGVTQQGTGAAKSGTLFELSPATGYKLETLGFFSQKTGIPATGPTLAPNGDLIGVTVKALYEYKDGHAVTLKNFSGIATGTVPRGQPAIGPQGTIVGTTAAGGIAPCLPPGGSPDPTGCGLIYNYMR